MISRLFFSFFSYFFLFGGSSSSASHKKNAESVAVNGEKNKFKYTYFGSSTVDSKINIATAIMNHEMNLFAFLR